MSDQLSGERADATGSARPGPAMRQVVIVVAAFAAAGALAGVAWEWIWTPPSGVVLDKEWLLDAEGLRGDFSGTGTYVVVAAVAGLLLGALVAGVFDRWELLTLASVSCSEPGLRDTRTGPGREAKGCMRTECP